ncbi:MaoC/PaaZ C-terminal domain-containing protein [Novosphingobium colocasiae]
MPQEIFQWIHTDVERSKREMGGTIAHGYLILSLIPLLSVDILSVTGLSRTLNYGLNRLRFTGIVQAGQRIRLRERILSVEPKGEGLLVTYEFVVETEGNDRPVCVAEGLGLMFPA